MAVLELAQAAADSGDRARDPAGQIPSRSPSPSAWQAPGRQGYDFDHLRKWLRERGIRHRIARKGIEPFGLAGTAGWSRGLCPGRMPTPAPRLRTKA